MNRMRQHSMNGSAQHSMNGMAKTIYALPAVFYFRLIGRQPNMNSPQGYEWLGAAFYE